MLTNSVPKPQDDSRRGPASRNFRGGDGSQHGWRNKGQRAGQAEEKSADGVTMQIVVTVPDQYALDFSAALLLFRAGQFSAGAACEFAGVDRYAFLEACRQHRIDVVDYDPDEIETDFAALIKGNAASC